VFRALASRISKSAEFLIIVAAVCWGLIGVFTRQLTSSGFSYAEIAFARSIITSLCLLMFLYITNNKNVKVNIKDIGVFVCMGGVGIALFNMFYFRTIQIITLSMACILLYTAPFMVVLMSALIFKDRITLQKICALFIAFTGCLMTVGLAGSGETSLTGLFSGLAAAFCFSQYTIFGKIALRKYDPFTVTAYAFGTAAILLIPFCDFGKVMTLLGESSVNTINLLIVGFFMTLIPFICYTKGLEKTEPGKAMIIAFIEPLTASITGIVVFGEMLSLVKVSGMALIFISLIILNRRSFRL
jgi:drug/metabolite transporter (DMT)-like permease